MCSDIWFSKCMAMAHMYKHLYGLELENSPHATPLFACHCYSGVTFEYMAFFKD